MKKLLTISFLFTILGGAVAQSTYEILKDGSSEKLLGAVNFEALKADPYKAWFDKNYHEYALDSGLLEALSSDFDSVEVFFGTWCGDSKTHVPPFIKVMKRLGAEEKIKLIGVDNSEYMYKQSPDGRHAGKNIHHVPTFIFYSNEKEIGRIIETPRQSIEKDLQKLVAGDYTPNYSVIEKLNFIFSTYGPSHWEDHLTEAIGEHGMPENAYALNTYARVLRVNERYAACKTILELNHDLFPEDWFTAYFLGLFCEKLGDYGTAIYNYELASASSPYSEAIHERIVSLRQLSEQ